MSRLIAAYCRLLSYLMALALALMVVLVFGNVVLRYGFNTGWTVTEELSRWLFVWMTFLGAVVALHQHTHLGSDVLTSRLSPTARRRCLTVALALMLLCLVLMLWGSYRQLVINLDSTSPVMEVSLGWFYAAGPVAALLGLPVVLLDLYRLARGQNLALSQDSEETQLSEEVKP